MNQAKDVVFLAALFLGVPVLGLVSANSRFLRDAIFFSIVVGTAKIDWLDINFLSRELYRGSTRGIEITYVDLLVLSLLLAIFISARRENFRFYWPEGLGVLSIFFLYCGLNVVACHPRLYGLFELTKVFRGLIVFATAAFYVRSEREMHLFFHALLTAAFAVAIYSSFERYGLHLHRVSGTFIHPNILSQYGCMLAPALLIYGMMSQRVTLRVLYLFGAALAAGTVILSMSRMGNFALAVLLSLALAGCLKLRFTQTNIIIAVLVVIAALLGGVKASNTLMSRYEEASLNDEFGQETTGRGMYLRVARAMLFENFLGVGLNNWSYWVSANADRFNLNYKPYPEGEALYNPEVGDREGWEFMQAAPAHNLLAITAAELGWPGLLLMIALWVQWFYQSLRLLMCRAAPWHWYGMVAALVLLAVFIQNLTEYVFRMTPVFFLTLIMVGSVSALLRNARQQQFMLQQKLLAGNAANGRF